MVSIAADPAIVVFRGKSKRRIDPNPHPECAKAGHAIEGRNNRILAGIAAVVRAKGYGRCAAVVVEFVLGMNVADRSAGARPIQRRHSRRIEEDDTRIGAIRIRAGESLSKHAAALLSNGITGGVRPGRRQQRGADAQCIGRFDDPPHRNPL
jgi:hypothetical protein